MPFLNSSSSSFFLQILQIKSSLFKNIHFITKTYDDHHITFFAIFVFDIIWTAFLQVVFLDSSGEIGF